MKKKYQGCCLSAPFFICAALISLLSSPKIQAACATFTDGELYRVAWVYDGDTLKLADGRKIRLIGINTPEISHNDTSDEPFARLAQVRLRSLLSASGDSVRIKSGNQKQDHYGRQLAHVYDRHGRSLVVQLLQQGLGFSITIPPNLRHRKCYRAAEQSARKKRVGLWDKDPVTKAADLRPGMQGFRLINGTVQRVHKGRGAVWLTLEIDHGLRADKKDMANFPALNISNILGRQLEVRGWITLRKGRMRMRVHHPDAIHWLD